MQKTSREPKQTQLTNNVDTLLFCKTLLAYSNGLMDASVFLRVEAQKSLKVLWYEKIS